MSHFETHHLHSAFEVPVSTSPTDEPSQNTPILPSHQPPAGVMKRRKMSKIKTSPILKRASSTPQMSSLVGQESGALSPSSLDKRRNKLGYQRISIACAHCRRRKIRCVLSEGDELGRCQNCIRLKKECVFYPVDSTGGTESRAQSKTSMGSKSSSVISNSPSERTPTMDHDHEIGRFPHLASNAPPEFASIDPVTGLGISTTTPINATDYAFDPALGARRGWNHGMYANEIPTTEPQTPVNWRLQEPQLNEFPTYPTTTADHSPSMYPTFSFPQHREDYAPQPPPLRSMSYGHIEPVIGNFAPQVHTPIEFARPESASHYNLTPMDSVAPVTCSIQEASMAPIASEPPMTPFAMYAPPPQQWGYYPQQPPNVGIGFSRHDSLNTQWYHQSQLGPAVHEHDPHHHQHPMSQSTGGGYAKGP